MEELKNCPNCGGVLDDTGRCMYCNSKVYDLTGINIDFDTHDILKMKLKFNGQNGKADVPCFDWTTEDMERVIEGVNK